MGGRKLLSNKIKFAWVCLVWFMSILEDFCLFDWLLGGFCLVGFLIN